MVNNFLQQRMRASKNMRRSSPVSSNHVLLGLTRRNLISSLQCHMTRCKNEVNLACAEHFEREIIVLHRK